MQAHYQQACVFLSHVDEDWAALIAQVGACKLEIKTEREPYEALIRAVAYQQLTGKAGDAILAKFMRYFGAFPPPQQLIDAPFEDLRSVGFSGRKIETLKGIAQGTLTGLVPTRAEAETLSDADLITRLVTLKGIGQWTVEMMLIFTLSRMDVLPAHDFGVVEGYKRLKKLSIAPKPKAMLAIAESWRPYRTVASWYLWQVPK